MSSSLRSARPTEGRDELLRRFVEASLRAQLVTIVNRARTEAELGDLVTAELCEVFEAEIAFVLARRDGGRRSIVGAYGLRAEDARRVLDDGFLDRLGDGPERREGENLLAVGARALACAPFGAAAARGIVGVARLYDQGFDEPEVALLDAVAESVEHALERLWLAEERDRLYRETLERAQAARVIGSIADGVLLVDADGIVRLWNPAAEAITGLSREQVLNRPVGEAIPGWSSIGESVVVSESASSRARATTVPVDVEGRELWLSIRGVGLAEGTVYAFNDLTEEHALEQLKADFIATVSHELRTPLAAVHGAAQTLLREDVAVGGEIARQLLALIGKQSERLTAMIDDILLASRVGSPELVLATEHVDVAPLAADVIAAARVHAGERVSLDVVAPPSRPPVAADPDKLRQVLTNLVANAVKYSPAGGRVEVRIEPRETRLAILVRDEGLGIAPSEQRLIFEKFYRVDANMARGVGGSGLGLYICRELLHRMGGTIAVESDLGEGSTFVVELPLAAPTVAADGETAAHERSD